VIHIVQVTWQELWRKRVLLITLLASAGVMGLFLLFVRIQASAANDGDPFDAYVAGTVATVVGLYLTNFTSAFLAIFSAAGSISAEIESGLLLAIVPRPLPRWQVYAGKWIAYTAWCVAYGCVMFWTIVLITHVELHYPLHTDELLKAFGLFELVPVILVTVTMLGSLFLPTLGNGIAAALLYMIGVVGGFLGRLTTNPTSADDKMVLFTSLLMPADAAYHRMVFELMGGANTPQVGFLGPFGTQGVVPSNAFLAYMGLYVLALLALGMVQFGRRDI
jgi:ABC-type transport system involved in multi-copper enzyme maturation permease subunit